MSRGKSAGEVRCLCAFFVMANANKKMLDLDDEMDVLAPSMQQSL